MSDDAIPELRPELLDDFYAEADEHLGNIRTQLSALEGELGQPHVPAGTLESLFRSFHSFKGISAMAGLRAAEALAHAAEGLLRTLSRGETRLDPANFELLVGATQKLAQMVGAHRLRQPLPSADELLRSFSPVTATEPAPGAKDAPPPPPPPAGVDPLAAITARGLQPWLCTFQPSPELDQRGVNLSRVRRRLAELGEIVRATPHVRAGGIAFEFLLALTDAPADAASWQTDGLTLVALAAPKSSRATDASASPTATDTSSGLFIAPSHIVRVDLSRLDELMRLTGELVIHRSRLEERIGQVTGNTAPLKETTLALSRSLRQLRTALTRMRLVPMAEIFTHLPFVLRDLSRETGRHVRLAIEGEQTEVDKYLVERLKEPLLHLVRNAFSHGLESPDERVHAGKPAEATILLRAAASGEFVTLEIRDDGRGIDREGVLRRALAAGLTVPEPFDDHAMLGVLCTPGFSTREEADRTAGRGVGMSVVQAAVRELGGSLSLESTPGRGTGFLMRLPLTLSIAEAVIVSAADQTCAVPQGFIDEIIQIGTTEVRTIKAAEVIPYRDGVLPVVRLGSLFGSAHASRTQTPVLVLRSERGCTGLIVDRVHTQREIVVRPMRDPLVQVPAVAGATELGDGRPVLILDAMELTRGVVRPSSPSSR